MSLLLLALACDTTDTAADGTDTGNPADTAVNDTADPADTADTDTADTSDTDTASGDDLDADGYPASTDCDDSNPAIHPDAIETCDGVDENCDGVIDDGHASVALIVEGPGDGSITNGIWYGYDADDNQVLVAGDVDGDGDGVFNSYDRYEWANGFQVAIVHSGDGTATHTRTEYDREADGTVTEMRYDLDGDGVWEYSSGVVYTDGLFTGSWYDVGNDGTYESSYGYVYNSYGMQTYYWEDNDGDGVFEREANYVYDGAHMISGSMDNDGDGVFETTQTNTWDGDRLMEELVVGGTYAYRRTYGYTDADDYWDTSDYDVGDDGAIDYRFTQTCAADGTITGQSSDQYADGVDVYSGTYEVDADGNIRNTSYMDGVVTSVYEYDYDDGGALTEMRSDYNGDGVWEWVAEYDTFAHLIYQAGDLNSLGGIDIQTWAYDERGRRTGGSIDMSNDGTLENEQWPLDGYACGSM